MTKKRFVLGIVLSMCCCLLFGSMIAMAASYTATPSWSKPWYSSDVTFKATTSAGSEFRGYYVFALATLRSSSGGTNLTSGGMQTNPLNSSAAASVSSQASYNNSQARVGYAEYGISSDSAGVNKLPGKYISMEYNNIY